MAQATELFPAGSTGDNSGGNPVSLGRNWETFAVQFEVTAKGSTPTADFSAQVSVDGVNWVAFPYVTIAADTLATAAITMTDLGVSVIFPAVAGGARRWRFIRGVVASNTNITYEARVVPFT